jgi:hypothetical protein
MEVTYGFEGMRRRTHKAHGGRIGPAHGVVLDADVLHAGGARRTLWRLSIMTAAVR